VTALASVPELLTYLNQEVDPDEYDPDEESEHQRAELLLDLVSAAIRDSLEWVTDPDPIPAAVKWVTLRHAAALYQSTVPVQSETIASYTVVYPLARSIARDPELQPHRPVTLA
jgi:hypothetical protein